MSYTKRRISGIQAALTPKQAVILWMGEAQRFPGLAECARFLLGQPLSAYPLDRLPAQVTRAVREAMKGHPRREVEIAVVQAVRDVQFLFRLHHEANAKLYDEQRAYRALAGLLGSQLQGLLLRQDLARVVGPAVACLAAEDAHPLDRGKGTSRAARRGHGAHPEAMDADRTVSAGMGKWRQRVEGFLKELYAVRGAVSLISERYFDGHGSLFRDAKEGLDQTIEGVEALAHAFNDILAAEAEGLPGPGPGRFDLDALRQASAEAAAALAAILVDLAKARALAALGEPEAAVELAGRYV